MPTTILIVDVIDSHIQSKETVEKAVDAWMNFLKGCQSVRDVWRRGDGAYALFGDARAAYGSALQVAGHNGVSTPSFLPFRVLLDWTSKEYESSGEQILEIQQADNLSKRTDVDREIVISQQFKQAIGILNVPTGRTLMRLGVSGQDTAYLIGEAVEAPFTENFRHYVDDRVRNPPDSVPRLFLIEGIEGMGKRYYAKLIANRLAKENVQVLWAECHQRLTLGSIVQAFNGHEGSPGTVNFEWAMINREQYYEELTQLWRAKNCALFLIDYHPARDGYLHDLLLHIHRSCPAWQIIVTASNESPLVKALRNAGVESYRLPGFTDAEVRSYLNGRWGHEWLPTFLMINEGVGGHPWLLREAELQLSEVERSELHARAGGYFQGQASTSPERLVECLKEALYHYVRVPDEESAKSTVSELAPWLRAVRDYDELARLAEECTRLESASPTLALVRAMAAWKQGRAQGAHQILESLLAEKEDSLESVRTRAAGNALMGILLSDKGKQEESLKYFQDSLSLYKRLVVNASHTHMKWREVTTKCHDRLDYGKTLRRLGTVYKEVGKYPEALDTLEKCQNTLREAQKLFEPSISIVPPPLTETLATAFAQEMALSALELGIAKFEMGNYLDSPGGREGARTILEGARESVQELLDAANTRGEVSVASLLSTRLSHARYWIARLDQNQGKYDQALMEFRTLEQEVKEDPELHARALLAAGHIYCDRFIPNQAASHYLRSLNIAERISNRSLLLRIHDRLHWVYHTIGTRSQEDHEAKEFTRLAKRLTSDRDKEYTLIWKAKDSQDRARYREAWRYYEQARKMKTYDHRAEAYALYRQGNIAYDLRDYEKAATLYDECLDLRARNMGDVRGVAWVQRRKAITLVQLEEVQSARALLDSALLSFHNLGLPDGEAFCLHTMAWLAHKGADVQSAEQLLAACEDISNYISQRRLRVLTHWLRARISVHKKAFAEAEGRFQDARNETRSLFTHLRLAHEMAVLYEQWGKSQEAQECWVEKAQLQIQLTYPSRRSLNLERFMTFLKSRRGT